MAGGAMAPAAAPGLAWRVCGAARSGHRAGSRSWQSFQSPRERAQRIALGWFDIPYPTFKRLALFAATQDDTIDYVRWVEWLVADDSWWLWSVDTQRETMRLLVKQGTKLSPSARATLETAILAGPPRHMYRNDLEPESWQSLADHSEHTVNHSLHRRCLAAIDKDVQR